ncbi:uncharacterized protein [Drosophila virilis]|uniref:BTB domain-containing protein n=1 Tax=Drosophila virilis TaxID=7244 RepID=B4M011_DROVI|nr:uncharacterized protein LOC6630444 [Drosophila virilis]EDW67239.1 uncharacterized protein Dvir_GJ23194 [Drosophila virilis]
MSNYPRNSNRPSVSISESPPTGDRKSNARDVADDAPATSDDNAAWNTDDAGAAAAISPTGELTESPSSSDISSTKRRRLEYFRNGIDADCEVHVPRMADGVNEGGNVCYKKFKCHRIFLATASEKLEQDVFQNKQWNGVLQINGVSPESVEIFLEFIYTFEITSSQINLLIIGDIFILSCAYNLPDFLLKFSQQLKNISWPLEGIFPAFNLAFRHNIYDLENVCLTKILENAETLKSEPGIIELQTYAFNFVIQHWLATEALTTNEIIQLLQQYQKENNLTFKNSQQFPHFIKIIKYFPSVLLDAEGFIHKY